MQLSIKFVAILLVVYTAGCSNLNAQVTHYPAAKGLPFSEAVQVGDMLYLSGQIGVAPGENKLVSGGIEAEARQAMDNIGATLERRGIGFDALVKCTVMLADMADWPAFNKVYVSYFKLFQTGRPARPKRVWRREACL